MAKCYVLEQCYDYEGCELLSVHGSQESAEKAAYAFLRERYGYDDEQLRDFERDGWASGSMQLAITECDIQD